MSSVLYLNFHLIHAATQHCLFSCHISVSTIFFDWLYVTKFACGIYGSYSVSIVVEIATVLINQFRGSTICARAVLQQQQKSAIKSSYLHVRNFAKLHFLHIGSYSYVVPYSYTWVPAGSTLRIRNNQPSYEKEAKNRNFFTPTHNVRCCCCCCFVSHNLMTLSLDLSLDLRKSKLQQIQVRYHLLRGCRCEYEVFV